MAQPTDAQIAAARGMVKIDRKLGRSSKPEVVELARRRTSRETDPRQPNHPARAS
ncbi:hypothetical protein [Rhodococcus opacus]|uniref:Uncharacterized protein n=1 Tax=Rhodococcus opacus (strain B4) TaxID=632772 RepID=C1B843_RHOOB|nr:hypothetical protein [Rhodococcus opacus]BAH51846.1 hypothetical protein ROP_35990 [Rhodococcus opacus B4]